MIIKNISGSEKTFTFSNEVSQSVANNGTLTVPDTPECVADALSYAAQGLIEITEGTPGAQLIQSASQPERVIFSATGQPADADTLDYGGVTFEFDSNDTVTAGNVEVDIGGSVSATLTNLLTAIEAHADLDGHTGRGVVNDGTNVIAAVSLPDGVEIADVTVDTASATNVGHYKVAAEAGSSLVNVVLVRTAATATLAQDLIFSTELSEIVDAVVSVYDASYDPVAWDGNIHIDNSAGGGLIVLDQDGTTDIADGHTVVVKAMGKA